MGAGGVKVKEGAMGWEVAERAGAEGGRDVGVGGGLSGWGRQVGQTGLIEVVTVGGGGVEAAIVRVSMTTVEGEKMGAGVQEGIGVREGGKSSGEGGRGRPKSCVVAELGDDMGVERGGEVLLDVSGDWEPIVVEAVA